MKKTIVLMALVLGMALAGCEKTETPSESLDDGTTRTTKAVEAKTDKPETTKEKRQAEESKKVEPHPKFHDYANELLELFPSDEMELYSVDELRWVGLNITDFGDHVVGLTNNLLIQYSPKVSMAETKAYYIEKIQTDSTVDDGMIFGTLGDKSISLLEQRDYTVDEDKTLLHLSVVLSDDQAVADHHLIQDYWYGDRLPAHEAFNESTLFTKHVNLRPNNIDVIYAYTISDASDEAADLELLRAYGKSLEGMANYELKDYGDDLSIWFDLDNGVNVSITYTWGIVSISCSSAY